MPKGYSSILLLMGITISMFEAHSLRNCTYNGEQCPQFCCGTVSDELYCCDDCSKSQTPIVECDGRTRVSVTLTPPVSTSRHTNSPRTPALLITVAKLAIAVGFITTVVTVIVVIYFYCITFKQRRLASQARLSVVDDKASAPDYTWTDVELRTVSPHSEAPRPTGRNGDTTVAGGVEIEACSCPPCEQSAAIVNTTRPPPPPYYLQPTPHDRTAEHRLRLPPLLPSGGSGAGSATERPPNYNEAMAQKSQHITTVA